MKSTNFNDCLRQIYNYIPGKGCLCSAWNDDECGCDDINWQSRKEFALSIAMNFCLSSLESCSSILEIEQIRLKTQELLDYNPLNYRPAHPTPE